MTSGPRPALACGAAPTIGSPSTTPASPACSATWVGDRSRVFGAAPAQTGVHHQTLRPDQRHLERFNRIPLDLDSLTAELLVVVDQTMQPTQASLWLRSPREPPRTPLVPWPRDHTVEPTGAPRGIRTPNRQIRRLVLCVGLVGSSRI